MPHKRKEQALSVSSAGSGTGHPPAKKKKSADGQGGTDANAGMGSSTNNSAPIAEDEEESTGPPSHSEAEPVAKARPKPKPKTLTKEELKERRGQWWFALGKEGSHSPHANRSADCTILGKGLCPVRHTHVDPEQRGSLDLAVRVLQTGLQVERPGSPQQGERLVRQRVYRQAVGARTGLLGQGQGCSGRGSQIAGGGCGAGEEAEARQVDGVL